MGISSLYTTQDMASIAKMTMNSNYTSKHNHPSWQVHSNPECRRTNEKHQDLKESHVSWTNAEAALQASDADILCIFDCCFAGSLPYYRGPAHFEYLGACAPQQTTPPGGPNSFTSALIWALKWFHSQKNSFDVSELQRKIKTYEHFPSKQFPSLGHRHPSREHIVISPQQMEDDQQKSLSIRDTKTSKGPYDIVDIRYHFDGKLDEDAFVEFARSLSSSGATMDLPVPVRRVQFIEKRSSLSIGGFIFTAKPGNFAADLFKRMIQRRYVYMWLAGLKKSPKCELKWKAIESRALPLDQWLKIHKPPDIFTTVDLGVMLTEEPEAEGIDPSQRRLKERMGGFHTPVTTDDQGSDALIVTLEQKSRQVLPGSSSTKRKRKSGLGTKSTQSRKKIRDDVTS